MGLAFTPKWKRLSDIQLADPTFGHPGRIDVLLGVHIFVEVLLDGQRTGPLIAFETRWKYKFLSSNSCSYSLDMTFT